LLALSHEEEEEEEGSADGDSLPPLGKVTRTIHNVVLFFPWVLFSVLFLLLFFTLFLARVFSQRMQ
jgi:hypothetical protein